MTQEQAAEDQVVLVVADGRSIRSRGAADNDGNYRDYHFNERSVIQNDPEWLKDRGLDLSSLKKKGVVVKAVMSGSGLQGVPARDAESLAPAASPDGVEEGPVKTAQEGGSTPRWPYDPASMGNMDLSALNAAVLSIDPNMPSFSTREEAIAQLSMDYVPQSSGQVT